ncbi:MAG: dihydroorotate dehydrogenase-like protein [Elusimicrobiota bacterium]|nr:dihydroorotate dehydrogenase-like protein [Elusimicrobiota bacterium]
MDLRTRYLGLTLKNPLMPSASPLGETLDSAKRLEDAGAAAVVLPSLFEEQIARETRTLEHHLRGGEDSYAEATSYLPDPGAFLQPSDAYLEHLRLLKRSLSVPVIASLNGDTPGGWTAHAALIEQAGADALELNLYRVAVDPAVPGARVEDEAVETVRQVRAATRLPLAVKIGPYYSSVAHMATRFAAARADGLVLFNRFYQPDIDLETLEVRPRLVLSGPQAQRLPLTWIVLLRGRVRLSLAATGGVATHEDALKMLLAGADAVMMASELLRRGPARLGEVLADMTRWLEEKEYESVEQLKGSMSQLSCRDPEAFERANYIRTIAGYHL